MYSVVHQCSWGPKGEQQQEQRGVQQPWLRSLIGPTYPACPASKPAAEGTHTRISCSSLSSAASLAACCGSSLAASSAGRLQQKGCRQEWQRRL